MHHQFQDLSQSCAQISLEIKELSMSIPLIVKLDTLPFSFFHLTSCPIMLGSSMDYWSKPGKNFNFLLEITPVFFIARLRRTKVDLRFDFLSFDVLIRPTMSNKQIQIHKYTYSKGWLEKISKRQQADFETKGSTY